MLYNQVCVCRGESPNLGRLEMNQSTTTGQSLAIKGGPKAIGTEEPDLFKWPIVTEEDERAIIDVLHAGSMSQKHITMEFETKWGEFIGTQYNLGYCNGTAAIMGAMYGAGLRRGDEIIAPSLTYWATALQALALGATPVFADIDKDSFCIDPNDIEHRITKRTKAIIVVHLCGYPCDMDPIMEIARRHNLKVIEDASHCHGALYKGRKAGTLGDVSAMSMMSRKAFAIGEAGMLCTNDRKIMEHAVAFGHYQRLPDFVSDPELQKLVGMPLGGYKFRMCQWSSAMGLTQLKYYPQRMAQIQKAMNRFWDLLEDVPGVAAHRPAKDSGSTMGGWYYPLGHYKQEELGGLPADKFVEALRAEGVPGGVPGGNLPLHMHPVMNEADVYGDGKPTRIAFSDRDLRQPIGSLPVTESLEGKVLSMPWFKHDRPESIERYAAAYRKIAEHADELMG